MAVLSKHEQKICARCHRGFECKSGDIFHCQCSTVSLLPETTSYLQRTHYGCLCAACLGELNQQVRYSLQHDFPRQPGLMVEGLHYYRDNGLFVFTELYHIQRGSCCQNGCRHCAYGYTNSP